MIGPPVSLRTLVRLGSRILRLRMFRTGLFARRDIHTCLT